MALQGLTTTCLLFRGMKFSWSVKYLAKATSSPVSHKQKLKVVDANSAKENNTLVNYLQYMGVDVEMARKRQPGVLKKMITHEQSLIQFLQEKGASTETIASIITRYPRAITRTYEYLQNKWEIWQSILKLDLEILKTVERSPESFFRSNNNTNLEENIKFFCSLGLLPKDLYRLLSKSPRIFSNRLELNRQMVDFLQHVCLSLGGDNPEEFVKKVLSKNIYLLIRSSKQVKANIEFLQAFLRLKDKELLVLLQGNGAKILDLSHETIKRNLISGKQKLQSLGCTENEVLSFFIRYPPLFYLSSNKFTVKIDCLLRAGIHIKQVLNNPRILDFSVCTLTNRIKELEKIGYNFQESGISLLEQSAKRFEAKLDKLNT